MTLLGPIFFAALIILPTIIAQMPDNEIRRIAVIDETKILNKLPNNETIRFEYIDKHIADAKRDYLNQGKDNQQYYAILYIPQGTINTPSLVRLFAKKQPPISIKNYIETKLQKEIEDIKLHVNIRDLQEDKGINPDIIDKILSLPKIIATRVSITTIKLDEDKEEKSSSEVSMALGFLCGFLIYILIFVFGSQVMRGVIEEKTNRIIEVIVSSVKPVNIMAGKIIGLALVGLTQFLLWIILTFAIITIVKISYPQLLTPKDIYKTELTTTKIPSKETMMAKQKNKTIEEIDKEIEINNIIIAINSINYPLMIFSFIFFFITGYLLYSSIFAAIGAAVDNEADTQQFVLPISIPLIISIIFAQYVITNPDSAMSIWLSLIPLTSPVIMMIRLPFGVPTYQYLLSIIIIILTIILTIWLSAKIYRIGILSYGKKITYKDLWKWIKYN